MATRNEPPIRNAPEGVEAAWPQPGHRLHVILLADYLDDVARRRYINQALAEHGIEPRRRHALLPIPLAGGLSMGPAGRAAKVAVTSAAVATLGGLTLAVIHDDGYTPPPPALREAVVAPTAPRAAQTAKHHRPRPAATSSTATRRPAPTQSASPIPGATASTSTSVSIGPRGPRIAVSARVSLPLRLPLLALRPAATPTRACVLRICTDTGRTASVKARVHPRR